MLLAFAAPAVSAPAFDHSALDAILAGNVRAGLVDYRRIRADHLADLEAYLARLAAADADGLSHAEALAFDINLYNATMLRAVIARMGSTADGREWSPADSAYAVFHEPLVRTRRGTLSLDSLEHGIIRARFHEPRVHVALVCAARGCPPLLPRAYRGIDLDATLERNLRAFAADTSRNRIDEASRRLVLSPIFDWYAADFATLGGGAAVMGRALGRDFRGWNVVWRGYDWRLNAAKP